MVDSEGCLLRTQSPPSAFLKSALSGTDLHSCNKCLILDTYYETMASRSQISLVVGFPKAHPSRALGALHRKFNIQQDEKLDIINGYSIDVPEDQVDRYIDALPSSATVMVDEPMFFPEPDAQERTRGHRGERTADAESRPHISRPAGLEEIHARGITGAGRTIAVIDSGLALHSDIKDRIKFFKDFSSKQTKNTIDPFGHGTHVGGIAAGDGSDVDGIAPGAELVGLRIKSPSEAIKAIEWAVENKDKYGIDIINLSLGITAKLPNRQDPFAQAAQQAIDAGIITIVASGNECTSKLCSGTISTPGTLPDAITVGAYNDGGSNDDLSDDTMWGRSSQGPTAIEQIQKPDLVAPGVNVMAPKAAGSQLGKTRPNWDRYHSDTGSSMATPMVSGAAALLLQVSPNLTQAQMKAILTGSANPIKDADVNSQGAGRLNLRDALTAAGAQLGPVSDEGATATS
jgi:subtilisin family serine protease